MLFYKNPTSKNMQYNKYKTHAPKVCNIIHLLLLLLLSTCDCLCASNDVALWPLPGQPPPALPPSDILRRSAWANSRIRRASVDSAVRPHALAHANWTRAPRARRTPTISVPYDSGEIHSPSSQSNSSEHRPWHRSSWRWAGDRRRHTTCDCSYWSDWLELASRSRHRPAIWWPNRCANPVYWCVSSPSWCCGMAES